MVCCTEFKDSDYMQLWFAKVLALVRVDHQHQTALLCLKHQSKCCLKCKYDPEKTLLCSMVWECRRAMFSLQMLLMGTWIVYFLGGTDIDRHKTESITLFQLKEYGKLVTFYKEDLEMKIFHQTHGRRKMPESLHGAESGSFTDS